MDTIFIYVFSRERQYAFVQEGRVVLYYNRDIRAIVSVAAGLTALLCRISLQFYCEFIKNNKPNIYLVLEAVRWIRLPAFILHIIHSVFALRGLVDSYREKGSKIKLVKILGKFATFLSNLMEALTLLKVFHFVTKSNTSFLNTAISLVSTVLLLFIAEPISCYCTYKEYQDACRKALEVSGEKITATQYEIFTGDSKKRFVISALTLSVGLLNFVLGRIEMATIPISLGNDVVYSFNLGVTTSMVYSALFLVIHLDKMFTRPIADGPNTKLCNIDYFQSKSGELDR